MSDTPRPKRPHPKSGRPTASEKTVKSEPAAPVVEHVPALSQRPTGPPGRRSALTEARSRRGASRPKIDALPARIGALEVELARMSEARGVDADELARMLVRIAETERAKSAQDERAAALDARVRELEAMVARVAEVEAGWETTRRDLEAANERTRRGAEALDLATRRAELAEAAVDDAARALERARAEREADRMRLTDLETKLARTRREHADELTAMRSAQADADQRTAHTLEDERAAAARARQQAAAAEAEVAAMRDRLARAAELFEEMDRRDEMMATMRARSVEQGRRILAGQSAAETTPHPVSSERPEPSRASSHNPRALRRHSTDDPSVEVMTLEDIEIDLAE